MHVPYKMSYFQHVGIDRMFKVKRWRLITLVSNVRESDWHEHATAPNKTDWSGREILCSWGLAAAAFAFIICNIYMCFFFFFFSKTMSTSKSIIANTQSFVWSGVQTSLFIQLIIIFLLLIWMRITLQNFDKHWPFKYALIFLFGKSMCHLIQNLSRKSLTMFS